MPPWAPAHARNARSLLTVPRAVVMAKAIFCCCRVSLLHHSDPATPPVHSNIASNELRTSRERKRFLNIFQFHRDLAFRGMPRNAYLAETAAHRPEPIKPTAVRLFG